MDEAVRKVCGLPRAGRSDHDDDLEAWVLGEPAKHFNDLVVLDPELVRRLAGGDDVFGPVRTGWVIEPA